MRQELCERKIVKGLGNVKTKSYYGYLATGCRIPHVGRLGQEFFFLDSKFFY